MKEMYKNQLNRWKSITKKLRAFNLVVTILVVTIQIAQVAVVQVDDTIITTITKRAITTVLPVVTSAVLAIQLKLGWGEKAGKAKKSAALYSKFVKHVEYRLRLIESGAEADDVIKMWNTSLISEVQDVPAFLTLY